MLSQITVPYTPLTDSSLVMTSGALGINPEYNNDEQNIKLLWSGNAASFVLNEPADHFREICLVGNFNANCSEHHTISYDKTCSAYAISNGYWDAQCEFWYCTLLFGDSTNATGSNSRFIYTWTSKNPQVDSTNRAVKFTRVYGLNRIKPMTAE